MKAIPGVLFMGVLVCTASAGVISLIPDITTPDPNEEVTVWVHTDEPLFCMGLAVYVTGDATITTAMSEADCNEFGWDNGWNSDPYIDPNGWVYLGSVRWAADANDIVGYFKFIYHSGQVSVYIDQENSIAFGWDGDSIPYATFSTETFLFGEPDPNAMQAGQNASGVVSEGASEIISSESELDSTSLDEQNTSAVVSIENSDPNATFQSAASNNEMAVNGSDLEEDNVIPANTYLSGENCWEGVYQLQGPVYVYSVEPNGLVIPASLKIMPGSQVIADANEAGIFLVEGSFFKATRAFFEPNFVSAGYWQGIDINGEPDEFEIEDCEIRAAYCGINVQHTRGVDISGCLFKWCLDGVKSKYATVHITNSVFDDIYRNAIEYWMQDPNQPDSDGAYKTLTVENCTITGSWYDTYYGPFAQDYGVVVHGAESSQNAASVHIANTLITSSWFSAVNFVDGWCRATLQNNGYFQNWEIYNEGCPFEDVSPVILPSTPAFDPFQEGIYNGYGQWDMSYLINEDCSLIDAGAYPIFNSYLIGNTCTGDVPDSNMLDIGYHYPLDSYFDEGYAPKADFNRDGIVNYIDFQVMSRSWLCYFDPNSPADPNDPNSLYDPNNLYDPNSPDDPNDPNVPGYPYEPNSIADLSGDQYVDAADLILFADEWLLESTADSGKGGIDVVYSKPVGDISGWLEMNVAVRNSIAAVFEIHLFLDGKDVGNIDYGDDRPLAIATDKYPNGPHALQFFAFMDNGDYITSHKHEVVFNNELGILSDPGYSTKRGLRLELNLQAGRTYRVGIYDILTGADPNGVAIFETTCTGDTKSITVPKEIFAEGMPIYNVRVQVVEPNEPADPNIAAAAASGDSLETEVQKIIARSIDDAWEGMCDGEKFDTVFSFGSDDLWRSQNDVYMKWISGTWQDRKGKGRSIIVIPPSAKYKGDSGTSPTYLWDIIKTFLNLPGNKPGGAIRWYCCAHGFSDLWFESPRTGIEIGGIKVFSELYSDYTDENRPDGLEKLWPWHENNPSFVQMGISQGGWLVGAVFDSCDVGADSSAARALGLLGPYVPEGGTFFFGWKEPIPQYETPLTITKWGEIRLVRRELPDLLNSKVTWLSSMDISVRDKIMGNYIRDAMAYYGNFPELTHWTTPDVSESRDEIY